MSPGARRILIPFLVALAVFGVLLAIFKAPPPRSATSQSASTQPATTTTNTTATTAAAVQPSTQPANTTQPDAAPSTSPATAPFATQPFTGLKAIAPAQDLGSRDQPPIALGSIDPRQDDLRLELTRRGAGIAAIPFSDFWQNAAAKRKAEAYYRTLTPGQPIDLSNLNESARYVLQSEQTYYWDSTSFQVPLMAAHSIVVNGTSVGLLQDGIWSQTAPGLFQTQIVDDNNQPIVDITRQFILQKKPQHIPYQITLQQRVRNLSDKPLEIRWQQYGPIDLRLDPGYIDRRRFVLGYLPRPQAEPNFVLAGDDDLAFERPSAIKKYQESLKPDNQQNRLKFLTLWPNSTSTTRGYGLSWFSSTNRYFGLAVHPIIANGLANASLEHAVQEIRIDLSTDRTNPAAVNQTVFSFLVSPVTAVAPGEQAVFDMGIYAGPLDRHVLDEEPYSRLAMGGMIVYRMASGCCTFLTFQWLAHFLLWFLSFLHIIFFDWGLAIIGLVIVVRALLHPLTKKSQVSIQRFGKQMGAMKPEIDKLQKKFPNDPKRVQQEQLKLMREHGVNPFQMLGCLPMFLQMPIWIALWAMLYLAFDIRQQPAFYGVFQFLGNWQFIADLSIPDNFILLPGGGFTIPLVNWQVDAVNLLPILMGLVFFFQQKYMSPPPSATMTPEQQQQQKIMKVMMVLMMPLFLYKAPSGLTLYILTSSCIGILESKYIRKHIDEIDKNPPGAGPGQSRGGGAGPKPSRNPRFRAWAEALERARERAQQRKSEPPKTFKKRK